MCPRVLHADLPAPGTTRHGGNLRKKCGARPSETRFSSTTPCWTESLNENAVSIFPTDDKARALNYTRNTKMTRWKPGHKDATRRQILDAAGRLFRAHGYAESGIAEVMSAAGLTVGAFYAHFASKEELLAAVLADAFARTRDGLFGGLDEL